MYKIFWILLLFIVPITANTTAVISGKVFIESNLMELPESGARVIAELPADTPVTINQRQSRWTQVETNSNTGWVPTLAIRISSVQKKNNVDGTTQVVTERLQNVTGTQQKSVVATFGIRGIDEEKLKTAQINEDQLTLLNNYKVSESAAKTFAQQANLTPQKIAYIGVEVEQ